MLGRAISLFAGSAGDPMLVRLLVGSDVRPGFKRLAARVEALGVAWLRRTFWLPACRCARGSVLSGRSSSRDTDAMIGEGGAGDTAGASPVKFAFSARFALAKQRWLTSCAVQQRWFAWKRGDPYSLRAVGSARRSAGKLRGGCRQGGAGVRPILWTDGLGLTRPALIAQRFQVLGAYAAETRLPVRR